LATTDIFTNWNDGDGIYVFPSNINLVFEFGGVDEVCFDFIDGGGEVNLGLNGPPVEVFNAFSDAPSAIAPNVQLSVFLDDDFAFPSGRICFNGDIQTLTVGGQEMAMDNVCFGEDDGDDDDDDTCELYDLEVYPQPCTPNGVFFVELDFDFDDVGEQGYSVTGNGQSYGTFSYNEPFPLIGPFQGDVQAVYKLIITDLEYPNCTAFIEFPALDCDPDDECEISDFQAELEVSYSRVVESVKRRRRILGLIQEALAQLAGFDRAVDLAPDRRLGRRLVEAREPAGTPTRLAVTAALARGHGVADADAVRDWAAPLFRRSVQELRAGRVSGLALLNLQAPYRL